MAMSKLQTWLFRLFYNRLDPDNSDANHHMDTLWDGRISRLSAIFPEFLEPEIDIEKVLFMVFILTFVSK